MGMMIHELKTVMETMKAVSVVLIEDLGSEVDCGGNYENGFCGPIERLRHKDQKHALHSATGTSGLSLVFPRCSIGSHWTARCIEVAVVADSKPPASFPLSVVSSNPAADSLAPIIFSMVFRPSPILALGAVCIWAVLSLLLRHHSCRSLSSYCYFCDIVVGKRICGTTTPPAYFQRANAVICTSSDLISVTTWLPSCICFGEAN